MKKNCLIAFCVFGYGALMAQSLDRDVTAVAGENFSNATGSLSWTLGECVTGSLGSGDINFSQGFQQTYFTNPLLTIANPLEKQVTVYPNPVCNLLKVEITGTDSKPIAELTDIHGRVLLKKSLMDALTEFDVAPLSPGVYLLYIKEEDGNTLTYKIEKNEF